MKTRKHEGRDRKKRAIVRTSTRTVAALLEPGERVSSVIPVHAGVHPLRRKMLALAGLVSADAVWGLIYFTNVFHYKDLVERHDGPFLLVMLPLLLLPPLPNLLLRKSHDAARNLVLTDRRVCLVGNVTKGWRSRQVIRAQDSIDRVRVDAVRPAFPLRISFGLRRDDGSTTQIFLRKKWLPEVEWLASCLDAGVAAPLRPDVLSASA
jgi:hypothetical protein